MVRHTTVFVSHATEKAARGAEKKIDALKTCIKSKPRVCDNISTSLESLERILKSLVSGSRVTTSDITQKAEEVLCLNISKCTEACSELMEFVECSKDGKVSEFDTTEEVHVKLLSNELNRWTYFVSDAVEMYLTCSSLGSPPMSGNINQEQMDEFSTVENDLSNMISKMDLSDSDDKLNNIIRMVNAQVTRINPSQTLLRELQSDVKRLRTRRRIYPEDGGQVINSGYTQYISGIYVTNGRVFAGRVGREFDINRFFDN